MNAQRDWIEWVPEAAVVIIVALVVLFIGISVKAVTPPTQTENYTNDPNIRWGQRTSDSTMTVTVWHINGKCYATWQFNNHRTSISSQEVPCPPAEK